MHRVNVILDIDPEDLMEAEDTKSRKKILAKKEKVIKINDSLFDIALRKGLIEKTEDGYIFIGDYEELLAFKKRGKKRSFDWLD